MRYPLSTAVLVLLATAGCGSSSVVDEGFFAGVSRSDGPFMAQSGAIERRTTAARYPFVALLLDEGRHHCSGTLVRPDLVVTARHCRLPPEKVSLVFPSDGVFGSVASLPSGSVLIEPKDVLSFEADAPSSAGLAENDIAYITLRAGVTQSISGTLPAVSFGPLPQGRALSLVGFPQARPAPPSRIEAGGCSTTGRVGDQAPYGKAMIETSCPGTFGNSGGPIFAFTNDGAPVLLGVVSHTFAVTAEDVDTIVPTGKDSFGEYVPVTLSALARATRQ